MANLANKGALFDAPDKEYKYSGTLTVDGKDWALFIYETTSKAGQDYLQISAYPKKADSNAVSRS